ncbi:uncharacterized protein J3D65DRAFT_641795 [Phyllosticta citribraziliensis]|uniref:Uncharacterized protein n=1 Tax=Phyllosticta citribraziliensis TaxID=989973 RepID=A0ABR1L6A3_9PEZI
MTSAVGVVDKCDGRQTRSSRSRKSCYLLCRSCCCCRCCVGLGRGLWCFGVEGVSARVRKLETHQQAQKPARKTSTTTASATSKQASKHTKGHPPTPALSRPSIPHPQVLRPSSAPGWLKQTPPTRALMRWLVALLFVFSSINLHLHSPHYPTRSLATARQGVSFFLSSIDRGFCLSGGWAAWRRGGMDGARTQAAGWLASCLWLGRRDDGSYFLLQGRLCCCLCTVPRPPTYLPTASSLQALRSIEVGRSVSRALRCSALRRRVASPSHLVSTDDDHRRQRRCAVLCT